MSEGGFFSWPLADTKVRFHAVVPTADGGLGSIAHEASFPTRQHALLFASFCFAGGCPEGAFGLDPAFLDGLTDEEREFVEAGKPAQGMPPS